MRLRRSAEEEEARETSRERGHGKKGGGAHDVTSPTEEERERGCV